MLRGRRRLGPGWLLPAGLWLAFSATATFLVSNQYAAVDGALRCLRVYWQRPPYIGPNNHLLYPVNVWLWSHLASHFGFVAHSPAAFLHIIAGLNAFCAGGAVALVCGLVWCLSGNWKGALLAGLVYALSWAVLVHATSSAEPISGLFASLIAALAITIGLSDGRVAWLLVGGFCLAWALANYESMFLIAPLLYLLCLVWPVTRVTDNRPWLPLVRMLTSMTGTVAGIVAIYGAVYYTIGITTAREIVREFFQLGGEPEVYAGLSVAKLANLPAGLANNLVAIVPAGYRGIRLLVRDNPASAIALACIVALVAGALLMLARGAQHHPRRTLLAAVCGGGLLLDLLPLLYWDPLYSKFWLQPLALVAVLGGVLAGGMERTSARRCGIMVALIVALEFGVNLPQVIAAHRQPPRCLEEASKVARLISGDDKVVTDFDAVSSLWMGLYDQYPARTLLFPATAPSISLPLLSRWAEECKRSGGRILFVGLLDQPRNIWEGFLGKRLKVPYDALRQYRIASRDVQEFSCEEGSLRVYQPVALRAGVH